MERKHKKTPKRRAYLGLFRNRLLGIYYKIACVAWRFLIKQSEDAEKAARPLKRAAKPRQAWERVAKPRETVDADPRHG